MHILPPQGQSPEGEISGGPEGGDLRREGVERGGESGTGGGVEAGGGGEVVGEEGEEEGEEERGGC